MAWSERDLAYLAGIIDGEGTVNLRRRPSGGLPHRHHSFGLHVGNTDRRLTDWLTETFGGSATVQRRAIGRYKPLYRWQLHAAQAEAVLRAVRPYLLLKGEIADLCLELRDTVHLGNNRITDDVFAQRELIFARVRALNQRGREAVS